MDWSIADQMAAVDNDGVLVRLGQATLVQLSLTMSFTTNLDLICFVLFFYYRGRHWAPISVA